MTQTTPARVIICLVASSAWLTTACATTHGQGHLGTEPSRPAAETVRSTSEASPPTDSLEVAIGKIRHLSQRAAPAKKVLTGPTIEDTAPRLAAALLTLATVPGPAAHRLVADEYRRLGILDAAFDHYRRAAALNPRDGAAYDGLARVWRDWGLPGLALGDARRAVYFAPTSAGAQNTLGTILQALDQPKAAREVYRRVLALDPRAAYALNNLCYLSILEGKAKQGIAECHGALELDPFSTSARHNLALAYAAVGRQDLARAELFRAGAVSTAYYNLGIINAARGDYASAAAAFEAACEARPWSEPTCARALQFRSRAERGEEGGRP